MPVASPAPMNPLVRRYAAPVACVVALAVAACGGVTRVVYDNADAAVLLTAHRHLSFEGEQWKLARAAVARFHAWHRRNELPRYAVLLADAAGRMQRGLGRVDVEWAMQSVRTRYAALVEAAVRESMPLLETLDAENVATLERRFAHDDTKRVRERLSGAPAKRERERVTAIVKRFEEWTGPFSERQVGLVRQFVAATADYPRHARDLRLRRERELVTLLDRSVQDDAASPTEGLRSLFLAWGLERTPEQRLRDEQFVQLVLGLDRSLDANQRARVVQRLAGYAEDARVLARGNPVR